MEWSFSLGWFIGGILIAAVGILIVVFYKQIADNWAHGLSSYEHVKLGGVLIAILGFILMANLHSLLLYFIFHLIMPNQFP